MAGPPVRDATVVVVGRRVADIQPALPPDPVVADVLTPGLVNAHAHLEYGPGFADLASGERSFPRWLATMIARRQTLSAAQWRDQARASVRALVATGTTCVADVVTHGPGLEAAAEAGLAGISYLESVGIDSARWPAEHARLASALAAAPPERTVGISPHTPYTLGTGVLEELSRLARGWGLRLHPHLGESPAEDDFVRHGSGPLAVGSRRLGRELELLDVGFGASPAAYLDSVGCLGRDVHVAHGVHLDAADRALLRERGTAVALCVRSNATLGTGQPPVAAYLAEGSPLAVGTDSLASVGSLDLLDELRALREVALAQGVPADGLAERLLGLATRGGAAAMGLDDVGRLAPGSRADLAGFSAGFPVSGSADPFAAVVESGRCVLTVVGGATVPDTADTGAPTGTAP
jgi:cytosine/adenosine deaminase-related metal-dependent hydrolase